MHIFADTANLEEIREVLKRGFVRGITTNPSLLAKEPKSGFMDHVRKIVDLIYEYQQTGISLSVEVFSKDSQQIVEQAMGFISAVQYPELAIKVQVGWNELQAIRDLKRENVKVNCTACMSVLQAVMAAAAGATYVSLFWGRIRDAGTKDFGNLGSSLSMSLKGSMDAGILDTADFDPSKVVGLTRSILDDSYPGTEIIVGSIRKAVDVRDAALAGAHIVTVPAKFFIPMTRHPKTDEVVDQFLKDFSLWLQ